MVDNDDLNDGFSDEPEKNDDAEVVTNDVEILDADDCVYCTKCGAKNKKGSKICSSCGCLIDNENKKDDTVRCPSCGSTQVEFVTKTNTQGFSGGNACCGWILAGPIGLLCGLCGMGSGSSRTVRKCKNCGKEF